VQNPGFIISNERMAADSTGGAHLVWKSTDGLVSSIRTSHFSPESGWSTPQTISANNNYAWLSIATDGAGNAMAVWSQMNNADNRLHLFSCRFRNGSGWESPIDHGVSQKDDIYPELAMNRDGDACIIWVRIRLTETTVNYGICARKYSATSGWEPTFDVVLPQPSTFPSLPKIAAGGGREFMATWYDLIPQPDDLYINVYGGRIGEGGSLEITLLKDGIKHYASNLSLATDGIGNATAVWDQYLVGVPKESGVFTSRYH
jgi:hypothetical protein